MSVVMVQRAMEAKLGSGPVKAVLLNLARHAHDDGSEARPAVGTISREMDLAERSVQRALRELEKRALIALDRPADRARGLPACYRVLLPPGDTEAHGTGRQAGTQTTRKDTYIQRGGKRGRPSAAAQPAQGGKFGDYYSG